MKAIRVGLISLACIGGATGFGVLANAAIDLLSPSAGHAAIATQAAVAQVPPTAAAPAEETAQPSAPAVFALASATSAPADLSPLKVKTVPIVYRAAPAAEPAPVRSAAIPMPRPRPATAPSMDEVGSIARAPASMAIAAATKTRTASAEEADPLSPASIDRIKTALALTAEQEEYWPAVAAELKSIAKQQQHKGGKKGQAAKLDVDPDSAQRLFWVAAPLITRLSYDQKRAVKQIARSMGLEEVAQAL